MLRKLVVEPAPPVLNYHFPSVLRRKVLLGGRFHGRGNAPRGFWAGLRLFARVQQVGDRCNWKNLREGR
jgi:hypothetical protein